MDIRSLLLSGKYHDAVRIHGKEKVRDEIDDMIYHDLADYALAAAKALGYHDLAQSAAQVVNCSGSYKKS